jgi:hypothetical protein
MGHEASEIDYFLHNLKEGEYLKKTVLHNLPENTSDHHPIKIYHNSKRILNYSQKRIYP